MSAVTVPCADAHVLTWWRQHMLSVQVAVEGGEFGESGSAANFYQAVKDENLSYRLVLPSSPVECDHPATLAWWVGHVEGGWVEIQHSEPGDGWFTAVNTKLDQLVEHVGWGWTYRLVSPSPTVDPAPTEQEQDATGPDLIDMEALATLLCSWHHSNADLVMSMNMHKVIADTYRKRAAKLVAALPSLTAVPSPVRPEGLPADAVEVRWFDHPAWVVRGAAIRPDDVRRRGFEAGCIRYGEWAALTGWDGGALILLRPAPAPSVPATETEDVPLAFAKGRQVLNGELVFSAAQRDDGTWIYTPADNLGVYMDLPVNDDGTVTVLAPSSDRGEEA